MGGAFTYICLQRICWSQCVSTLKRWRGLQTCCALAGRWCGWWPGRGSPDTGSPPPSAVCLSEIKSGLIANTDQVILAVKVSHVSRVGLFSEILIQIRASTDSEKWVNVSISELYTTEHSKDLATQSWHLIWSAGWGCLNRETYFLSAKPRKRAHLLHCSLLRSCELKVQDKILSITMESISSPVRYTKTFRF